MWSLISNTGKIKALYKDEEPSFKDLTLVRIEISVGDTIHLLLTVETRELPKALPDKWKIRRVDRIRHTFSCSNISFLPFHLSKYGCQKGSLKMQGERASANNKGNITVTFIDELDETVFSYSCEHVSLIGGGTLSADE